ncbi:MAG: ABC transporter ATP-binding protein [Actinobacteria bacterium]|nr:ABC transporter ATP-binding protein [Actinomycetota bacterium]
MTNLLDVRNLRTEFRVQDQSLTAVDDVSFSIGAGECFGLVGESGCGKTTTGLAILQLLPVNGSITGGSVLLNGQDLASLSERELRTIRGNQIALIPQDPMTALNPVHRIGRQIAEPLLLHRGMSYKSSEKRVLEVLEMVEVPFPKERLRQFPHELSGGLRQRMMIAMALVCEPKLLIADEPTTALDVTIQAQILDILDTLRQELKMGVLLVTHDMGVIAERADRVGVMYAGKMVEEASTATLFNAMRHPYAQALLAAVPSSTANKNVRLASIAGTPPSLSNLPVGCRYAERCTFAQDHCRVEQPPMSGPEPTHTYACFNPVSGPSPVGAVQMSQKTSTSREAHAPLLTVASLTKEFPVGSALTLRTNGRVVHAVSDVSFVVRQGETFGLVGESGCGKTTIGHLITGIEQPTTGTIHFAHSETEGKKGRELRKALARERQMMFQDPYASLDPRMRVGDIIAEPLAIQGDGSRNERNNRVTELFDKVGLDKSAIDRFPHEFSGGQRQRIGLARALALDPRLIVADEPVSALDVSIQAQMLNLMGDLQRELGLSYVFISHDLAVVRFIAQRIGVMYLGQLVEVGDIDSVFNKPAHHYTSALTASAPQPDPDAKRVLGAERIRLVGELPSPIDLPTGCRFSTRCPAVTDLCRTVEPALETIGNDHQVRCHFPLHRGTAAVQ